MRDTDGKFSECEICRTTRCRQCGSMKVKYREWDSNCGAFTDYQYKCQRCGHVWWVDGIDA